jgi:hypothetical protein
MFVAAMALTGGRRENRQLVTSRQAGLMAVPAEEVDRVDVERAGRHVTFERMPHGWARLDDRRALSGPGLEHLAMSLRFMHVAEPVRVMERREWEGTPDAEFGLAPARCAVTLSGKGRTILVGRFGGTNPQQVLQYVRVDGRAQLYLMPRFVGVEWERLWDGVVDR